MAEPQENVDRVCTVERRREHCIGAESAELNHESVATSPQRPHVFTETGVRSRPRLAYRGKVK